MQQLTKNVFIETGWSGANVGCIITTDGLVMIDTPHKPSDAMKWQKEVESKGTVKYLINTESHDDHFTCDFFFKVPVVAQEKAREAIVAADVTMLLDVIAHKDPKGFPLMKGYQKNVPAITFSEHLTLYLGNHTFQLIHTPGHSAGQASVLIPEERMVFTGDNVCYKIQGFLHEADPYAWLESLKIIEQMDVDYIVPGHGDVTDKSFLKEQVEFVQECTAKIKDALNQGWTKEEAIARVSFERYPMDSGLEEFGKVLLEWSVGHMYEFLSQKR